MKESREDRLVLIRWWPLHVSRQNKLLHKSCSSVGFPLHTNRFVFSILPTRSVSLSALTQWGEWRWFDNELLSVAILYRSPSNCHVPSGHLGFISASGLSPCNPQQRQQEAKWLRNGSMLDLSFSPLHHKESGILTNPLVVEYQAEIRNNSKL